MPRYGKPAEALSRHEHGARGAILPAGAGHENVSAKCGPRAMLTSKVKPRHATAWHRGWEPT